MCPSGNIHLERRGAEEQYFIPAHFLSIVSLLSIHLLMMLHLLLLTCADVEMESAEQNILSAPLCFTVILLLPTPLFSYPSSFSLRVLMKLIRFSPVLVIPSSMSHSMSRQLERYSLQLVPASGFHLLKLPKIFESSVYPAEQLFLTVYSTPAHEMWEKIVSLIPRCTQIPSNITV